MLHGTPLIYLCFIWHNHPVKHELLFSLSFQYRVGSTVLQRTMEPFLPQGGRSSRSLALEISVAIKATLVLELLRLLPHRLKEGVIQTTRTVTFGMEFIVGFLVRTYETRKKRSCWAVRAIPKKLVPSRCQFRDFYFYRT